MKKGINPCVITRNDLMEGVHKENKYLKYILHSTLGHDSKEDSLMLRTKILKEKGEKYRLTLEEQIKCIIGDCIVFKIRIFNFLNSDLFFKFSNNRASN